MIMQNFSKTLFYDMWFSFTIVPIFHCVSCWHRKKIWYAFLPGNWKQWIATHGIKIIILINIFGCFYIFIKQIWVNLHHTDCIYMLFLIHIFSVVIESHLIPNMYTSSYCPFTTCILGIWWVFQYYSFDIWITPEMGTLLNILIFLIVGQEGYQKEDIHQQYRYHPDPTLLIYLLYYVSHGHQEIFSYLYIIYNISTLQL